MGVNQSFNFIQFVNGYSPIISQSYRIQPKLAILTFVPHMDMWWFISCVRIEVETVGAYPENCWHMLFIFPERGGEARRPEGVALSSTF